MDARFPHEFTIRAFVLGLKRERHATDVFIHSSPGIEGLIIDNQADLIEGFFVLA